MTPQPDSIFHKLVENQHMALMLFNAELKLVYANPACEMLFEISMRHLMERSISEIIKCEDKDAQTTLLEVIKRRTPYTGREIGISTPNKQLTVDCSVIPVIDPDFGDILIIEMQQVDRQMRITYEERLISQQQASRELIRGLAHEIKNPLGGLRGAAQLLQSELDSKELTEYTEVIIAEADRLRNLVNRMLGPNQLPHLESLNIHEVLERVRQLIKVESGDGLDIVRDYDPSIPKLEGDKDQLIQALLNIASNAAHAVNNEGQLIFRTRIKRQFTIGQQRHDLVVQIEIEDGGPGIPENIRNTLFLPMVSASNGGIGLGLSISQSLVARHNGLIECNSKPGQTIFTIYLPLELAAA
jgi:two-component system nitrogen regulation sensor histidine kinase GlnL